MVLGVDPGTRKCGYAVVPHEGAAPVAMGIVALEAFPAELAALQAAHPLALAAIGTGTNAARLAALVTAAGLPHVLVDERDTTLQARRRFFCDHPPQGWKRLVPLGMLLPGRPIDDYAALLIAERFFSSSR